MNYNDRRDRKKRIVSVLALVLAVVMVLSLVTPFFVHAATLSGGAMRPKEVGQDAFEVTLDVGFKRDKKNVYIVKQYMPLSGTVKSLGNAFDGEIQVKLNATETEMYDSTVIYAQDITLGQGAATMVEMEIGTTTICRNVEVTLVDRSGNVVFRKFIYVDALPPETAFTGVFSDQKSALQYVSQLNLPTQTDDYGKAAANSVYGAGNATLFLNEETFPSSLAVLSNFKVLIIDDFNTKNLTQEQQMALNDWVTQGGTLILGTGIHATKVLSGLPFLQEVTANGTSEISGIHNFAHMGVSVEAPITVANLSGDGLESYWEEGQTTVVSKLQKGNGVVVIPHFALSLAPLTGGNAALDIVNIMALDFYLQTTSLGQDEYRYDYKRHLAQQLPAPEESSIGLIFAAIIAYIVLVGPILYAVLKKLDKREKGWMLIPMFSVIFLVLVSLATKQSGYATGVLRSVAAVELNEGSTMGQADIGIVVKTADMGDVLLSADSKLPLKIVQNNRYYYDSFGRSSGDTKVNLSSDKTEILFYDKSRWSTNYLNANTAVDMGGEITCSILPEGANFVGEITNHTQKDFDSVYVSISGIIVEVGELKAGESLHVDLDALIAGKDVEDLYYSWRLQDVVREEERAGTISRTEAYKKIQQIQFIQDLLSNEREYVSETAMRTQTEVFAFTQEPLLAENLRLNNKSLKTSSMTMYHQKFAYDFSEVKAFETKLGATFAANGYLYAYNENGGMIINVDENMEVFGTYVVPQNVQIDEFVITNDMTSRYAEKIEAVRIYDFADEQWVSIELGKALAPNRYIYDGEIRLAFDLEQYIDYVAPTVTVKGGGLNAAN